MRLMLVLVSMVAGSLLAADAGQQPGVVRGELIFETAPFRQCHASTIVETKSGLIAAWFGGAKEGHPDVGIWLSRHEEGRWSAPVEVANGVVSAEERGPCWNPVLFQPKAGPLLLFYKMSSKRSGSGPSHWLGMLKTSADGGRTWSAARQLPDGRIGPVKNKPVQLPNGDLLCPSSTEDDGWRVHFERTSDLGKTWHVVGPVNDGREIEAIQPSILFHPGGRLQAVGRTRQGKIFEIWSDDGGKSWGKMTLTTLPNPNSGTDAVTLADGRHLLVYNHTGLIAGKWGGLRSPLNVAVSRDGHEWRAALVLESERGEFSYPAVIQAADGLVHITYTWKRERVKHVVVDPAKLSLGAVAVAPEEDKPQESANSIGMKLVRIPAGEFMMGGQESAEQLVRAFPIYNRKADFFQDEYPCHRVRITRPFWLGRCEVTVGQFKRFTAESGYKTEAETDGTGAWGYDPATGTCGGRKPGFDWRNPGFAQTDNHPVLNVTWNDAVAFCRWLGTKEKRAYRLPTEAEWEYACRAGASTRYSSGADPKSLLAVANVMDDTGLRSFPHVQDMVVPGGANKRFTMPVGSFRPNAWGLFDMHGNVWEWCADWYGDDTYAKSPVENPHGPADGGERVRRGGAWNSFPLWARASFRNWNTPDSRCVNLGFRVARDD